MSIATGSIEPTWIAKKGALVYENISLGNTTPADTGSRTTDPVTTLPGTIRRRYGNGAGMSPTFEAER